MANVYIVEKEVFFKNELVGEVKGISAINDISCFSNKEKAIEFVEKEIKKYQLQNEPKFDKYDYLYDMNIDMVSYAQNDFNVIGVKRTYRIIKKKII